LIHQGDQTQTLPLLVLAAAFLSWPVKDKMTSDDRKFDIVTIFEGPNENAESI
jgi:hypothetical protein